MPRKRNNLLYIMTDQQRRDSLSAYGETACRTPHLDRLAASGARFDNAYTVCHLCGPARASMLTGMTPQRHGLWTNPDAMGLGPGDVRDDVEFISSPLSRAGYDCRYVGKWHAGHHRTPLTEGFSGMAVPGYGEPYELPEYEDYLKRHGLEKPERDIHLRCMPPCEHPVAGFMTGDERAHQSYFLAERAIEQLREHAARDDGRPLFLFLSFWDPHEPYLPPRRVFEQYDIDAIEPWPQMADTLEGKPEFVRRYRDAYHRVHEMPERQLRELMAYVFAATTWLDEQIGRVLDALDELGLTDETAVLFASDHGDTCGSRGLYDKDAFMMEELMRVPMIARAPGLAPVVVDQLTCNMDLAPTALALARLDPPEAMDGLSLLPLMNGDSTDWREALTAEFSGIRFPCALRMLRWSRYKYIFNPSGGDELYDLESDPLELSNRIDDGSLADAREECRGRLFACLSDSGDDIAPLVARLSGGWAPEIWHSADGGRDPH